MSQPGPVRDCHLRKECASAGGARTVDVRPGARGGYGVRRMRTPTIAAVLATAIATRPAQAGLPGDEDRVVPCRTTIACTADLASPGIVEIEGDVLYRRRAGDTGQWTFPLLFKLTLLNDLQLQAGTNGYTVLGGKSPA